MNIFKQIAHTVMSIIKISSPGSKQIKYLRQSVTLTAFGDPMFDAVGNNIAEVHALFGRIVGSDRLQACSIYTTFDGMAAVEMSNRYFTLKNEVPNAAARIPLEEDIDPHGNLSTAAGNSYVHTAENQVNYFERQVKNKDDHRYFNQEKLNRILIWLLLIGLFQLLQ